MNNWKNLYLNRFKSLFFALMAFVILGLLTPVSYAESRPLVANRVIAYQGDLGSKVWVLRIGERKAHEALVQIENVDHDWDLSIHKMKITRVNDALHYSVNQGNKRHVVLILKQNSGQLFLPNEPDVINLYYNDTLSQSGDAQAFLTQYLANKK